MSEKKVLILVNHEVVIYNFRKEFVLELINKGYKVYISSPGGKKIEELESLGCTHVETDIDRRGVNPLKDLKLFLTYQKMFKRIRPDIIYSYTIKPNIYGAFTARILNIPFIATVTGLGSAVMKESILRKIVISLYKGSLKRVQRVFFQNTENLDFFINNKIIDLDQMELVAGSGVNLAEFKYQEYPKSSPNINFIYIGRLMREKGVLELFKAANYFKEKTNNIHFHILGFLDDDIKSKVDTLNRENIIIYHGEQSDIRPFLKESHAIIHPSYHEGLSNVLLEAAASGRPILASDIPGCRETFDEGITGLAFKAQSAKSLIDTIENFLELPYERKKKMGILGRQKIEREFNRQIVVDAYIDELNF